MQQAQGWLDETSAQQGSRPLCQPAAPGVVSPDGEADQALASGDIPSTDASSDSPAVSLAVSLTVSSAGRPDKFQLETRLIELGAAMAAAQVLFKNLERDFYLAAFGRYDE